MQLKDQVAIITGAASPRGIGWATAKRFADEGARVVILDLDAQAAEQAARTISHMGHPQQDRHLQHLGLACDVRDEGACRSAVQRVLDVLGRIDILVNNAGVSQSQRLLDSTQADYDLVMDSSVRGAFNMSRAVVPHMRERRRGACRRRRSCPAAGRCPPCPVRWRWRGCRRGPVRAPSPWPASG